jgi:hypothetical protein
MDSYYDIDEFGSINDIQTIYPKNPFDEDKADNLFGFGNPKRRAAKKLAKAEKQLAKGHTKKAEKKLMKAEKILSPFTALQTEAQGIKQQIHPNTPAVTNTTNPAQTENVSTPAGQIGSAAQPPVYDPNAGGMSGGGGGGDMSSDMPYSPDTTMSDPTAETTSLSTPDNPITLPDVVVKNHPDTKNMLLYIVLAIIAIAGIMYFSKKKKK